MGPQRTRELQKTINDLIARLGWSRKALARQLYCELNEIDDEEELRRFEERLKKELTRSTTKPELLEHYLDVIRQLPECEKAGLVVPQYIGSKHLDSEIEEALRNISSDLSKSLGNKNPD